MPAKHLQSSTSSKWCSFKLAVKVMNNHLSNFLSFALSQLTPTEWCNSDRTAFPDVVQSLNFQIGSKNIFYFDSFKFLIHLIYCNIIADVVILIVLYNYSSMLLFIFIILCFRVLWLIYYYDKFVPLNTFTFPIPRLPSFYPVFYRFHTKMLSHSICLSLTCLAYHLQLFLNSIIFIRSTLLIMSIDVECKNDKSITLCISLS